MKNESIPETNDEVPKDDDFAIDTAEIFINEIEFRNDPEHFKCKKSPDELVQNLEHIIRKLLVKYAEPTVDYSDDKKEYLIDKFERFKKADLSDAPFRVDFFVTAYDKPGNKNGDNDLSFKGTNYYYFYSYNTTFIVNKSKVTDDQFEVLFAFALRHCDLMQIHSFLHFHLLNNFEGKLKQYCQYLTQINRKFGSTLFTTELSDSIKDWISDNEINTIKPNGEKIKTYLTVKQLAFLFRALKECKLIEGSNAQLVGRVMSKAFDSKAKEDLSAGNLSKHFYDLTDDAVEFWLLLFPKLEAFAKKQQEINRK